jgi:hypothetical protein
MDLSGFDEEVEKYNLAAFEEAPTMLGSAAQGALQGASLGFSDEAEALIKSALSGELSRDDYSTKLEEIRQRYKKYEEANPIAYTAGNFAGGMALPVVGRLPLLGKLLPNAITAANVSTVAGGVKAGLVAGALTGLGSSEADLTSGDVTGALKDAGTGAIAGGIAGAVIPGVTRTIKGAKNFLTDQPMLSKDVAIFKDAARGITHSGEHALEDATSDMAASGERLLNNIQMVANKETDAIKEVVAQMDDRVRNFGEPTLDISDILSGIKKFQGPFTTKVIDDLKVIKHAAETAALGSKATEKSPTEVYNIIKALNEGSVFDSLESSQGKDLRSTLVKQLNEALLNSATPTEAAAYNAARQNIAALNKVAGEMKIPLFSGSGSVEKTDDIMALLGKIKKFDKKDSPERLQINNFIRGLEETSPEVATEISKDIEEVSRKAGLVQELYAPKVFQQPGMKMFLPSARAKVAEGFQGVGSIVHAADEFVGGKIGQGANLVTKIIPKRVFESIDRDGSVMLKSMADKLRGATDKSSIDLLGKLESIVQMSPNKQKAMVFALIQNPSYRKSFEDLMP